MFPTNLVYFDKFENWGDPDAMDHEFLFELERFRNDSKIPMIVTCGTQGHHGRNSKHFIGKAADIVMPTITLNPVDLIFEAMRFDFTGIGFYTYWKYNGVIVPGLHLERDKADPKADRKSLWLGITDQFTRPQYVALTQENLERYAKF